VFRSVVPVGVLAHASHKEILMAGVNVKQSNGASTTIDASAASALAQSFRGELLTSDSAGYDQARAIWNAMIDRRPAMIARCATADDVVAAVRFAKQHGLLVAVRGGGHNIAGNAMVDGGLVIDLSRMKAVTVDAAKQTVRVEGGATLGDLDQGTQAHGLAVPVGINSTTGVAGLTLGGGFGWLSRKYGLTIDNLLSVDVVTAAGEKVTANERDHADLFWAVRGGGGNFGVVTSFEFKAHKIGTEVLAGLIVHPLADARKVLQFYREFTAKAPEELAVWFVLRKAPPLPFLPEQWHGKEILALAACWNGDIAAGEKALQPLRSFGNKIADIIGPMPYVAWQTVLDPLLTPGQRNYWKSHEFLEVSDGLIDVLLAAAGRLPDPQTELAFAQLGGAIRRVKNDATAYSHREANYLINVHGRWADPASDAKCVAWARELFQACAPFATGAVYVNFLTQDEEERVRNAYGASFDRLAGIKKKYDPSNFFRLNQNIRPGA
jgi:FAD/FMN-containing dehydrogenase